MHHTFLQTIKNLFRNNSLPLFYSLFKRLYHFLVLTCLHIQFTFQYKVSLQTQSHATTASRTAVIGCRPWYIIIHCNTQLKVQAGTTAINHCKNNVTQVHSASHESSLCNAPLFWCSFVCISEQNYWVSKLFIRAHCRIDKSSSCPSEKEAKVQKGRREQSKHQVSHWQLLLYSQETTLLSLFHPSTWATKQTMPQISAPPPLSTSSLSILHRWMRD